MLLFFQPAYAYSMSSSRFQFEVDTRNPLQPVVTAILKVDGEESYRLKIYGRPIKGAIAMGDMAKSFLELLGFRKRKWF